ncbi:LysM peptidoglycan-binding domain-containing protein [Weissella koreensis]|uniref:LysM peptidoglycan-binding domain-containing protein n=1 Tax=Weissella koreensis TaxID=165096 RepID=A0A7H1MKU6_9LACO|nr:LysM peptidoglycan-binding domain-containing protein [Weissella koreensis]EJF33840.1 peptidoglycan-binding LysM [Weissella koreensis KCTC 3621]QGN20103.1 LysM peptidoglycan-binding domain-containing protein [Weissella koreensis]QNT64082.1 LysM peptidoglycan-binding domain-containing protein [Weissella koreensis]
MNKVKETALTVAGLTAVFGAGQTAIHAATTYTVEGGDTLSDIATKFNTTVNDLVQANNLKDANLIIKDQELVVSDDDTQVAASTATATDVAAQAADDATTSLAAESSASASEAAASSAAASEAAASSASAVASTAANTDTKQVAASSPAAVATAATGSGSVYDQFIAAGGTASLWQSVVMPESGGNPNAVSPNGYHGLGQTMNSWGYGSVANQTSGMISYAVSRYGSIDSAIAFRSSHGWW